MCIRDSNEAAHRLRRGVNHSIGMLVLDVSNPFFTDIASGVDQGLASSGRPLLLGNSAQDRERELAYLCLLYTSPSPRAP